MIKLKKTVAGRTLTFLPSIFRHKLIFLIWTVRTRFQWKWGVLINHDISTWTAAIFNIQRSHVSLAFFSWSHILMQVCYFFLPWFIFYFCTLVVALKLRGVISSGLKIKSYWKELLNTSMYLNSWNELKKSRIFNSKYCGLFSPKENDLYLKLWPGPITPSISRGGPRNLC